MPDKEYIETCGDWGIRYAHCYAKAETGDKYAPVIHFRESFYSANGSDQSPPEYAMVDMYYKNQKNVTTSDTAKLQVNKIDLTPLELGAVNLNKSVVVIRATKPDGNAKYRQLPHDGSIKMIDPFRLERKYLKLRSPTSIADFFILTAWANNTYLSAPQALKEVSEHTRLGAAFSPNYFFGISLPGDGVFLFKNGLRIARVNAEGCIMLKPKVHQLAELLSEYGLNVKRIQK